MIASASPGLTGAAGTAAPGAGSAPQGTPCTAAAPRRADHPDALQRQPGKIGFRDRVEKLRFDDQNLRAGILQVIADLRAFRGGVDRHRDGADPGGAEKHVMNSARLPHISATRAPAKRPASNRHAAAAAALSFAAR